jgi:polar amino acid transport system substrate-binding protein
LQPSALNEELDLGEEWMSPFIGRIALAAMMAASVYTGAIAHDMREILARKGKLRVGVYPGSPTSMVRDEKTGETHGLS